MRVLEREVEDLEELGREVENKEEIPSEYHIAVESLLFDRDLNWILMKRGPGCRDEIGKLEGVGGQVEGNENFKEALRREISEEVGDKADIEVLNFFEVRRDIPNSKEDKEEFWLVVSFLCLLRSGDLKIKEPEKNKGFHHVNVHEIDSEKLSSSASSALRSIREEWPEIKSKLRSHMS